MIELGIYKITCLKNNKFYIGSSVNINRRLKDHLRLLRKNKHTNKYLQNAWNKYGESNFKYEIIETIHDISQLLTKEKIWIDDTKCYKKEIGFNVSIDPSAPNTGKFIDLTGLKFGKLIPLKYMGTNKYRVSLWLCRCECGNKKIIHGGHLKSGKIKSCGCIKKELDKKRNLKHGHSRIGKRSKTYQRWQNIIDRCTNPNNISYKNYDKIKIKICYRWSNKNPKGFENFLKDMGKCPGKGYSIYKINNNRPYCKLNCKWITHKEKNRNRKDNRIYCYNGRLQCIAKLAEDHKIHRNTLQQRLDKGLSIEQALTIPVRKIKKNNNV